MDAKQIRIGIQARIPDDRDGLPATTARQLEDCRAFAAGKGREVAIDVLRYLAYTARLYTRLTGFDCTRSTSARSREQ